MALFDVYAAHNVECQIYDVLCPAKCLPIPKVWYARQAKDGNVGVIVMADLTDDGVGLGWTTSLTLQQVSCAEHLSPFVAYENLWHFHLIFCS